MRWLLEKLLTVVARQVRALLFNPVDLGVIAVVEQAGKVVLVRHSYKSGWLLPGGAVERNEPPGETILRELREEIGLTASEPPELYGVYTRRGVWVTNYVLLYRVRGAQFTFKPSWEIRELRLVDPENPPLGTGRAPWRRFQEIYSGAAQSPNW